MRDAEAEIRNAFEMVLGEYSTSHEMDAEYRAKCEWAIGEIRADERKKIVAWLRTAPFDADAGPALIVLRLANAIERGEYTEDKK